MNDDTERCAFCGATVESPCEYPPVDTCEKALNATYGDPLKKKPARAMLAAAPQRKTTVPDDIKPTKPKTILTLHLDERHNDVLDALAAEQGMSKAAVLRQALRLYKTVNDRAKNGQDLAFVSGDHVFPMLLPSTIPLPPDPGEAAQPADVARLAEALDWIDDFIARCNGDDRGACEAVNQVRAALAAKGGDHA